MQIRRRLDSRSKVEDQFVISLNFDELAELYAGSTQALRSVRTPLPMLEQIVDGIEQIAMDDEYRTMARLQLATPDPVLVLGPGGRYRQEVREEDLISLGVADGNPGLADNGTSPNPAANGRTVEQASGLCLHLVSEANS